MHKMKTDSRIMSLMQWEPVWQLARLAGLVVVLSGLQACTAAPSSNVYSTVQAGTLQDVKFATVVSVRNVIIQQNATETGKAAGGVIGAVAGSEVGKGKGRIVGSVAGAVAGSTIGGIIDRTVKSQQGLELTLRMKEDQRVVAIAQVTDEVFKAGDEVKVLSAQGKARVTH